jgi:tRNA modification GTPase
MPLDDTIAAIATAPGVGGIGIIRISGPLAETIARLLYRSPKGDIALKSNQLYHGQIISPATGVILDEVLIALMREPRSYTGEDLLEIHGHGNPLILEAILTEVIRAGARPASPGEFTRRAFLNNRIDLTQAEALMGLISARTSRSLEIAHAQLQGGLHRRIEAFRQALIEALASLEVATDFTEEEGERPLPVDMEKQLQIVTTQIQDLLCTYPQGKMIREGASAVIMGRTNVGKSSLLNRLIGENRAIVTEIPGTTRDFIEEGIDIRGIAVRLTDTAGLRDPENIIEKEGIDRVWERLSTADLVILVFDGSAPLTVEDHDILEKTRHHNIVPVFNKSDLDQRLHNGALQTWLSDAEPLRISAKTGTGIPDLKEAIYRRLTGGQDEQAAEIEDSCLSSEASCLSIVITQIRHKTALEKTIGHLQQARESLTNAMSSEFIAFDLREALDSLGEIVGATTSDDVLDRVFSTFCIGK